MAADWIGKRPLQEVVEKLNTAGVSVAPIYTNAQVAADPHVIARGALASVPDDDFGAVKMPCVVPRLSTTPGEIRSTGPALGAHNSEVFGDWLGLSESEQASLSQDGAI
jgi:crotonobetainyl-CoA:carnitine CoA-transferase CaiB-like acyl-CoA transferase